ncbi:unnamed protein product [Triticum turgidum subsp. durum]|uniref:Protein LNK1 n=1 Tax=Triticum turgidum subsp. durum TaxID=4567 RepID=A0A9R0T726_TRITD|nr:unnamed protein product [Triticum turgidum subsp. durum]
MPDWKAGEFEGKFKDEFAQGNNNLQEDGAGPLNISNKKLKHGITSEENLQGVVSTATNSDSQKFNSEHIYSTCVVASNHVRDCKIESSAFPLSRDDTTSGTRYQTENWNNCQFALSNGSAVLNNHSVPQSDLNYGDNDLNFIDWPSIDNFEDVDTLFRGCDSTYGEQQLENTDELSWIPSSDAIYSSDVALQAGFDTSYSDYGMLDDLSAFPCAQDKSLPTADEQFNDNYPFNEQKNVNVYGEQSYHGGAMELLSTDQICNGDGNIDMIGERYSSENALQQLEGRKFSVSSGSQLSSSQNLLKQKHHSDKTSPIQKQVANLQPGQLINDEGQLGQQTLTRRASYPCENYEVEKKGFGKRSKDTLGTSVVVDGSFVSSLSSDNSVEESSFQQLQDAVSQLDVKTKLCIRDGLYRLARSAQNRPVFPNAMNRHEGSRDVKDTQSMETSGKFVDHRSIETQTNPIDRSIALLLFHQPSQVAGAVDNPRH